MNFIFQLISMLVTAIIFATTVFANDSAVEISVGGLQLRKEHSVSMTKERLYISKKLVSVEYEFRNVSQKVIVSEIGFPIPGFKYEYDAMPRDFADFKAWVDGRPITLAKEVKAFINDRDITEILNRLKITIENFGNFEVSDPVTNYGGAGYEISKLTTADRDTLVSIGALRKPKPSAKDKYDPYAYSPFWEVRITYHWTQEFKPDVIVNIRHDYKPVTGYGQFALNEFSEKRKDACLDQVTLRAAKERFGFNNEYTRDYAMLRPSWVDYILTTANTWQTPIRDFELVIERESRELITLCWDGPVERISENKFRARLKDFVPNKELRVYFLTN